MRVNGRARVDPRAPRAFAICDRCGGLFNHQALSWQLIWAGPTQIESRNLVCIKCKDRMNPNLRPILVPPDPVPVIDPRPEFYSDYETDYRITEEGELRILYPGDDPRIIDYGFPPNTVRRTAGDFDPVDPGENEVFAFDFYLALGNNPIATTYWSIETISGPDAAPLSRLIGPPVNSGQVSTHRIGGFVSGTTYRITVTAETFFGTTYTLWTTLACNALT